MNFQCIHCPTSSGGSRAGGLIADCWAALIYYGRDGYVQKVKDIVSTTKNIETLSYNAKPLKTTELAKKPNAFHVGWLSIENRLFAVDFLRVCSDIVV